jgi:chorismate mutase
LKWLVAAREASGLPVCTEVANAKHVGACLEAGLDAVWIGARTTVSPFAVQEIAEALRGTAIPVLVKNPMHADLKLWIGAIERVQALVEGPVWALHRGFTGYQHKEFRNAPMWEIPIALRSEKPEVPVLCDPSHIGGRRDLLEPVAQKAMDLGMAGLMLEVHPNPAEAWSDANQQVTPERFEELLSHLTIRAEKPDGNLIDGLAALRMQMDSVDEQLVELLAARMDLARSIGQYKKEHGITILQLERWKQVVASRNRWGQDLRLGESFMLSLLEQVHNESIRVQTEVMNEKKSAN